MKRYLDKMVKVFFTPLLILLLSFVVAEVDAKEKKDSTAPVANDSIAETGKMVDVAYGKQNYDGVTSSIGTVSGAELLKTTSASTGEALIGRLPGLTVMSNSYEPGSAPDIYIRGLNTYGGNNGPLILVDGFRTDYNQISLYEIESISVLKDAAAVAMYGQDAANGVLLVTTKRGKIGKATVDVNFNYGWQQISQMPDLLNAAEYATLYNQALRNDGLPIKYDPDTDIPNYGKGGVYQYTHPDNDYFNQLMKSSAPIVTAGVNLSGGTKTLRYMVTGGFMHNGGMYNYTDKNDGYSTQANMNRFNLRTNLDIQITKKLSVQVDMAGRLDSRNYPGVGAGEILGAMYMTPPQEYPMLNPDGSLGGSSTFTNNPYGLITSKGYMTQLRRNLDMTVRGKYDFGDTFKGFSLGVSGSAMNLMYLNDNKQKNFAVYAITAAPAPGTTVDPAEFEYHQYGDDTDLSWGTGVYSEQRLSFEANAAYDRTFGDHAVSALLMYHMDRFELSDNYYKYSNAGFGLRAHYGYKDRYFAEFTSSYYGQEQYKKGSRFGFFPAGALAWVVSKENFLKNSSAVNYLKLRASYGKVGGQAFTGKNVYDRIYYNQYYTYPPNSTFGSNGVNTTFSGRAEGDLANPWITWDKSYKTDISIEGTFFNHIQVMFDYFHDRRSDILTYDNKIPGTLGLSGSYGNGGEVKNQGYEATLGYFGHAGDFEWGVNAGVWYNHSEIIKKPDATIYQYAYRSSIGKPVGQMFGYTANGFWDQASIAGMTVQPTFGDIQPGDVRYMNMNDDNVIDDNDVSAIGYSWMPEYTYTVSLNLKYKGVYLYAMGQGTINSTVMFGGYFIPFSTQGNAFSYARESWTEATAAAAKYPRLSTVANSNNNQNSTLWMRASDYFKLRNVELGYEFPKNWLSALHLKGARVYLRGQNLATWAKEIDFIDPETLNGYPAMRSFNVGLNVTF